MMGKKENLVNSITGGLTDGANALFGSVSNLWSEGEKDYSLISSKNILKVGSILQNIFQEGRDNIEIPRLVVVGSQSSGKSSLLNGILSFDLLPTDKNMCTRTPLHLELIPKENSENIAEFGRYVGGSWESSDKLAFSLPNPTLEEQKNIGAMIEKMTIEIVGNNSNISDVPIHLKIYSKSIPNLTLVDLPGLTMVACTDRGQPKDIKEKIRALVGKYIERESTIILAVMPARTDVEADMGLDLIKQYDPKGERTVGVLTKVDLMNDSTDVIDYLKNNVSKDLQLNYGYYAVRNRTTNEKKRMSVIEGFKVEDEYFKKHPTYGKLNDKSRLGVVNMTRNLSEVLVDKIKESLPIVLGQINSRLQKINDYMLEMGSTLPENSEGKYALVHSLINYFNKNFVSTIEERGGKINTGRNIKDIFVKFREDLSQLNPFNEYGENKEYISECIRNCEGNHMTFPSPPIEVLEKCLTDINREPINILIEPSKKCCDNISSEIINLIDELLNTKRLSRFPNLTKKIKNELTANILSDEMVITKKKIEELLKTEINYIWTDDKVFRDALNNLSGKNLQDEDTNVRQMNGLLKLYFNTIIDNVRNNVPKIIMYFLIKKIEDEINLNFYEKIMCVTIDELLEEESNISLKRKDLRCEQERLLTAKKSINSIL